MEAPNQHHNQKDHDNTRKRSRANEDETTPPLPAQQGQRSESQESGTEEVMTQIITSGRDDEPRAALRKEVPELVGHGATQVLDIQLDAMPGESCLYLVKDRDLSRAERRMLEACFGCGYMPESERRDYLRRHDLEPEEGERGPKLRDRVLAFLQVDRRVTGIPLDMLGLFPELKRLRITHTYVMGTTWNEDPKAEGETEK